MDHSEPFQYCLRICQRNIMWNITSSIVLVSLLISFSSGWQRRDKGVTNLNCPLDDDPDNPTFLQLPGECSKFLKCSYGLAFISLCPLGLQWADELKRCEKPVIANCNPALTTPPPAIGGNGCSFTYQRHPSDCRKLLQCVDGVTYEFECPEDSFWDSLTSKCSITNYDC